MKNFCRLILTSLVVLSSFPLLSIAGDEARYNALTQLNLSDSQKAQIETIKSAQQAKISSLQAELKTNQKKLNELLQNDASSDEEIAGLKAKIDGLQNALSDVKVKSWLKVKAVLTPEQNNKLRSLQFGR